MRRQGLFGFCAAALIGCLAPAHAATGDANATDASMLKALQSTLARSFVLDKELPLDPAVRSAADRIGAAHLERMAQVLPLWIQEERAQPVPSDGPRGDTAIFFSVWARMLNELALWSLEPGDASYEQGTLDAVTSGPMVCRTGEDARTHDFGARIMRIQALPPERRDAMLASERILLARWGKPRPQPAMPPFPLPQDAAMAAIGQIRSGGPRPQLALPPVAAAYLLGDRHDYADAGWDGRCMVQQWWMRVRLAQGAAPATALAAFRYGTMLTATYRLAGYFESEEENAQNGQAAAVPVTQAAGAPAYPKMAQRFEITGSTTVTRSVDAAGKPRQPGVSARNLSVPGIRGVRPVAFDDAFDALSIAYALTPASPRAPVFMMMWTLEGDVPATKGSTP